MPAESSELSPDGRFRLHRIAEPRTGWTRLQIRLEHVPTARDVLSLTGDQCSVESCFFSRDGGLLHLTLGRSDSSLRAYPATLDLRTGLYYHHPDPRQTHGPAGQAEDLETLLRTGRPPEPGMPVAPIRWPSPEELAPRPAPHAPAAPPAPPPPPAPLTPDEPQEPLREHGAVPDAQIEPDRRVHAGDGAWQADLYESGRCETSPSGVRTPYYRARIFRVSDGAVVADLQATGHEAWVLGERGRQLQISRPTERGTWTLVDLDDGTFHREDFRGPLSEPRDLVELDRFLRSEPD